MIGLVLVTHGQLCQEFVNALEHVVGPQEKIAALSIQSDDDMEQRRKDIIAAIADVEDEDGVIILTDMFGGTPSNLAISLMKKGKVEVLAGVNLPLLVKLASLRNSCGIAEAVEQACLSGRKYINVASHILSNDAT